MYLHGYVDGSTTDQSRLTADQEDSSPAGPLCVLLLHLTKKSAKTRCAGSEPWPLRALGAVRDAGMPAACKAAKKVWRWGAWHLRSRFLRKEPSHIISVFLCQQVGPLPSRFSGFLTDRKPAY